MVVELKFDLENPNDRKCMDFFNKRKEIMELLRYFKNDLPDEIEDKVPSDISFKMSDMVIKRFNESDVNFEQFYF